MYLTHSFGISLNLSTCTFFRKEQKESFRQKLIRTNVKQKLPSPVIVLVMVITPFPAKKDIFLRGSLMMMTAERNCVSLASMINRGDEHCEDNIIASLSLLWI
jgi:hypothetical protein